MSAFQKRHYVKIAKLLNENNADGGLVAAFADLFAEDNSLFDRDRFYMACIKGRK
jgi:hypothetical protein